VPTYSIVTTEANETMSELQNRMPAMLLKEEFDEWLDPTNCNTAGLKELLKPFPDDAIEFHKVNKKVVNMKNNSKKLIEAV